MDQGIGMVIEALEESGKIDNTLIFFLSDNGGVAPGRATLMRTGPTTDNCVRAREAFLKGAVASLS